MRLVITLLFLMLTLTATAGICVAYRDGTIGHNGDSVRVIHYESRLGIDPERNFVPNL